MYKPERPEDIDEVIREFTKQPLPHFFKYAKDKTDSQVVERNQSFVNKLDNIIPNPRINCRNLGIGEINYKNMMDNPNIEFDISFTDKGRLIKEETDPLIVKYCEFDREYYFTIDAAILSEDDQLGTDRFSKKVMKYRKMADKIKFELSQFGYSDGEIADILVKFLYGIKKSRNKTVLWMCYGDYIIENLKKNFEAQPKTIKCVDCGEWVEQSIFDSATCRCKICQKNQRNLASREGKARKRMNEEHTGYAYGSQNGRAQGILMCDKNGNVENEFDCIEKCCEYMLEDKCGNVKNTKIIRVSIERAIRNNKTYKGFLFKKTNVASVCQQTL